MGSHLKIDVTPATGKTAEAWWVAWSAHSTKLAEWMLV